MIAVGKHCCTLVSENQSICRDRSGFTIDLDLHLFVEDEKLLGNDNYHCIFFKKSPKMLMLIFVKV